MMLAAPNPLLPATYDLVWTGVLLVVLALAIAAIVLIMRDTSLDAPLVILLLALVILVPVLGPVCYFLTRVHRARRAKQSRSS